MNMRKVLSPVERLDQACEQFIGEFCLDPIGDGSERSAIVDNLTLSLGMSRLVLAYRTPEEQQAFFAEADNPTLESMGNPSARIQTYTHNGQMAFYNFDRNTGLVVVNSYPFDAQEVRALRAQDADALGLSIATRGLISSGMMNRALTEAGMERLTTDVQTAIKEA
jgi:hypothetical protein